MTTTITIDMPDLSGEAGPFSLFLRKRSDNTLLNTGGDTLTEIEVATVKTGVWSASISETIPAEDCYARVYEGTTETAASIVGRGILYNGQTEVGKEITGDATIANQETILATLTGGTVTQVASPNVNGNLVLTQGDDYDNVANPKASWTVSTDYTTGWTVRLTIRDADDATVYTTTGTVASATSVQVTIAAPTGLTMIGCPGQWQGKFDVELTHSSGKKKTIALGTCYINEDQTRV